MSFAKESGHWYSQEGDPKYTIVGANGKERNTNLRDARKHNFVPSVTTIMNIVAKPGLELWKRNQLLMSALTLPKIDGESLDSYSKRIQIDSGEHAKKAAEKGTLIHGILEDYFLTGKVPIGYAKLVCAVEAKLNTVFGEQKWIPEKSFATKSGYGGKVDLHSDAVVVDFKTTEFTEDKLPKGWPEQVQQLAAYGSGLGLVKFTQSVAHFPRCANVYVSVSEPGLVHIKEWKREEIEKGFGIFMATLNLWKKIKGYDPAEV